MNTLRKLFIMSFALTMSFMACDDSSTGGDEDAYMSVVSVSNQGTMNGNQVTISEVMIEEDGWVVVHRSNASNNGPMVPDIIGKAWVEAGTSSDVTIQLEEGVSDDETLYAMLHEDTGTIGEYEFDGQNGFDNPVTYNEEIVLTSFTIDQTDPMITVTDQVNQGNTFVMDIDAAEDGWIVIHASNANNDGPEIPGIIGKTWVEAGMNTDVQVMVDAEISDGDILYPMLHFDTGTIGEYEFDGQNGFDGPVLSGTDIVVTSFTVQSNTSNLIANDQMVTENAIMVDVTSDTDGWVVVHRSNASNDGPMVPDIIGKAWIEAGVNTDVEIMFADSIALEDGEQLWPMVHFDTGTIGEYEFDGANGFDNPVIVGGNILMTSITVSGPIQPSIQVSDQSVQNNMLTIDETNMLQGGFVVLHRDTGNDAPVVPASIGHGFVQLGETNNLQITLNEGESLSSGDNIWAMLHIDNGTIGSYDFDGSDGSDDPPVFDALDNIVMVQFTIQ